MRNRSSHRQSSVLRSLENNWTSSDSRSDALRRKSRGRSVALLTLISLMAVVSYTTTSASSIRRILGGHVPGAAATAKPVTLRSAALGRKKQLNTSAKQKQDEQRTTSDLNIARKGHTATTLSDARILIVGGENSTGTVEASEVYDPMTRKFSLSAKLRSSRSDHTATPIPGGRILIVGGHGREGSLRSTEIFDPAANAFSRGPSLTRARSGHTATVLADGRILIAGGDSGGTAEIIDPATMKWTRLESRMATPRSSHSAILLKSGKVLIVGGLSPNGDELSSGELFDPETLQFSVVSSSMRGARNRPALRELPDGKVQVIGGDAEQTMEMFNAEGRYFTARARLVPESDSETSITEVLRAPSRAALIQNQDPFAGRKEGVTLDPEGRHSTLLESFLGRDETLTDLLDRSGHTMTEMPLTGTALITGGKSSSGMTLMSATETVSSSATVTTDKTDYAPGETVIISGTGWLADETVELRLHRDEQDPSADTLLSAVADANGDIQNSEYVCQESDLGVTFLLTATGQTSGFVAQTTFTDAVRFQSIAVGTQSPDPVIAGNSATYSITLGFTGNGSTGCSGTLSVITEAGQTGLPNGASASFNPNPVASGGADQTSNLTINTDASLSPAGTYTFTVQAVVPNVAGGQGCNGATLTATATLVVTAACSAPSITCPAPVTVQCDSDVPAPATDLASFNAQGGVAAPSSAACGPVTIAFVSDVPSGSCPKSITRTYRATDSNGNTQNCSQIITVHDTLAPLATTAASSGDRTLECSDAGSLTTALAFVPSFTDNCDGSVNANLANDQTTPDANCANAYTRVRKWTAADGCGNTSLEFTQTITVVDTTEPVATTTAGAGDATLECSNASGLATALAFAPSFNDNCTTSVIANLVYDHTTPDPNCGNAYIRVRRWTARDGCDNISAEYTQTISVVDTTAPTITNFPPDATVSCANLVPQPNDASVTATDNCGGTVTITHSNDLITGQTCPNRYTITRTYHATDACGNVTNRSQTITVNDTTAPSITCQGNLVYECSGSGPSIVTYPAPTASDTCGGTPTIVCIPPSGSTFPIGSTPVNCSATDSCGNSNSCSFTVTVAYNFVGFFQPVDNPPGTNIVKAGQSVPLKFQLMCGGNFISDLSAVTLVQSVNVICDGEVSGDPILADDSGSSGLHYDYVANQFVYSWKTQKQWANTCRRFILTLNDGSTHEAYFQFKK